MIFYFHGFASSGKSWKTGLLKEKLPEIKLIAPTLPVNPLEVVELFEKTFSQQTEPVLVIGSSLGGFYAYYVATRFKIPAVILNPSLTPWSTLKGYTGMNKRYYSGETFEWKPQYLDSLNQLNKKIKTYPPQHHLLHFYLATDDGVLNHKNIPALFPKAGSIRFLENCSHSFSRFEEIIPDIAALL
ncbi:MAG: esterase [bacterium]|nr:esterase [bacterium]